ncbi:MAG: hypothetical protein CVU87_01985 [Firmicutes bacterium HGW-Firmicutes-12]|jgi:hypothetical protein|nr:MAG: hypothetical protein CVU87_01985 [Firmicutes bacterium HGW-Firmicutes-12]
MQKLLIEKTNSTPFISFDAKARLLEIKGESYPENVAKFYTPVLEWLQDYLSNDESETTAVEFEILYFNSSSSKIFMTIFDILEQAVSKGKKILVKWICDEGNETAIECGEEFKEDLVHLPFDIKVY